MSSREKWISYNESREKSGTKRRGVSCPYFIKSVNLQFYTHSYHTPPPTHPHMTCLWFDSISFWHLSMWNILYWHLMGSFQVKHSKETIFLPSRWCLRSLLVQQVGMGISSAPRLCGSAEGVGGHLLVEWNEKRRWGGFCGRGRLVLSEGE